MEILPRFEAKWLEEDECEARVTDAWERAMGEGSTSMVEVQRKMLSELWQWDRNVLGELEKRINKVKKELEKWQDQQNVYWKQRAHNTWLTKGDRNTGFFHAFASKRKRKNYVKKLRNEAGDVILGEQLKSFIANQYQQLFLSGASV